MARLEPLPIKRVQSRIPANDVWRIPNHRVPATRKESPRLLDLFGRVPMGSGGSLVVADRAGEAAGRVAMEE